ncbi:molybdenum cofactor biosynthesis protein MoaE [Parasedimentitalea huanghaiensis]|uniref:Molybdopterin synthase catalytic subunit n=1 Tax=Parasedimentitalea huanghaiensis TaxID=2682100 RepID=A0A6L6WC69_9RHOB|nr:molybdenum cofactor biosynthesis protein MoaE [Zongyanglinia huanghaiensis]MVO15160.1 molybdenum cofactor biosynthesis protein MoaE [Zongyanglinia huanghaiensis]
MQVSVQEEGFEFGARAEAFAQANNAMGAIVTFTGIVRDADQGGLVAMEIEHYPGMTLKALTEITQTAMDRWSLGDALVIHRYGRLAPGEQIMMVATASRHRKDAFEAAEYLMDYLKSRAPFWKKEILDSGTTDWVAAKDSDEDALDRW